MKKIPTVFIREYKDHKVVGVTGEFTNEECRQAFLHGTPTLKVDGTCCAVIGGKFYKRFDAKKGRKIPADAIPCCEPDPVTGHHPHWVPVTGKPDEVYLMMAAANSGIPADMEYQTYEAIGPHIQGNPYGLDRHILVPHGCTPVPLHTRTLEGVKAFLEEDQIEGIVFWYQGEPVCKIKRSDFGIKWPCKGALYE